MRVISQNDFSKFKLIRDFPAVCSLRPPPQWGGFVFWPFTVCGSLSSRLVPRPSVCVFPSVSPSPPYTTSPLHSASLSSEFPKPCFIDGFHSLWLYPQTPLSAHVCVSKPVNCVRRQKIFPLAGKQSHIIPPHARLQVYRDEQHRSVLHRPR